MGWSLEGWSFVQSGQCHRIPVSFPPPPGVQPGMGIARRLRTATRPPSNGHQESSYRYHYLDLKKGCPGWRSLSSGLSGDPFEGAGMFGRHLRWNTSSRTSSSVAPHYDEDGRPLRHCCGLRFGPRPVNPAGDSWTRPSADLAWDGNSGGLQRLLELCSRSTAAWKVNRMSRKSRAQLGSLPDSTSISSVPTCQHSMGHESKRDSELNIA